MVFLNLDNEKGYYHYAPGVNAANMTKANMDQANSHLAPRRERLINSGSIKRTSVDKPPQSAMTPSASTAVAANKTTTTNKYDTSTTVAANRTAASNKYGTSKYAGWTRREMRKALLERGIMKNEEAFKGW